MKAKRYKKNSYEEEKFGELESALSYTLKPIEPRPLFVNQLRGKLSYDLITYKEQIRKTKFFIFLVLGIISGLLFFAVWIHFIVYRLSLIKKKRIIQY